MAPIAISGIVPKPTPFFPAVIRVVLSNRTHLIQDRLQGLLILGFDDGPSGFSASGEFLSFAHVPIFREQMPNITPHVCRHTYCSIQARAGMYPKTLQYLMGHSDISVTMNTYTHLGLEDAVEEMGRMQEIENARKEQEKLAGKREETRVSKKMFRAG